MFSSLGFSELLLLGIFAALVLDAKKVAGLLKWLKEARHKLTSIQFDLENQLEQTIHAPLPAEIVASSHRSAEQWREKTSRALRKLDRENLDSASEFICKQLLQDDKILEADTIAAFCALKDEPDLDNALEELLRMGKNLLLPRLRDDRTPEWVQVTHLDRQLTGKTPDFRQPLPELPRAIESLTPQVLLLPGRVFGLQGERIGRGKGTYETLLSTLPPAHRIGIAFDAQIADEPLLHAAGSLKMNHVITEKRRLPSRES